MNTRSQWVGLLVLLLGGGTVEAAQARFHYLPSGNQGPMVLAAPSPCAAPGEMSTWFGSVRQPIVGPPRPTHFLSFRHAFTGCLVTVPLALPQGTPNIQYQARRVVYNYGSYTVSVLFLADGSVDVIYNSGLMRDL
jgi:hypothetical protein